MRNAKAPRVVNTCSIFHFGGRLDFSNMDYERAPKTARGLGGTLSYCDSKVSSEGPGGGQSCRGHQRGNPQWPPPAAGQTSC